MNDSVNGHIVAMTDLRPREQVSDEYAATTGLVDKTISMGW